MGTGILLSLIVAAIIILSLTLIVLFVRQPQQARIKNDKVSLEMISYSPVFKKLIDSIIPPAEEREYRKNERLISDSGYNLSMREFYLLKVIVPIILLIVFLSIYFITKCLLCQVVRRHYPTANGKKYTEKTPALLFRENRRRLFNKITHRRR